MCLTEAALRHRPRPAAHQGRAAGRRHLQAHRQQDLHLGRRARPGRRTSSTWCWRACPTRRRARKGISLFVVPKFNVERRRLARRAQRASTAAASSTRWASTATPPAQIVLDGAIGTLVGEPNKGLAAMFVMMNAARLGVGMQSLGLTEVAYQNALAYAKDRIQMRSLSGVKAPGQAGRPDHRAPRRAQDAADRARLRRRRPRAGDLDCALLLDKELHQPDENGAQGLRPSWSRCSRRSSRPSSPTTAWIATIALHAGLRRPRLHPRMGHGAVRARRPHQHDLRRHQHHPVARPAGPQGAGRQRRQAEEVRQAGRASFVEEEGVERERCRSSSTRSPTWATRSPSSRPRSA